MTPLDQKLTDLAAQCRADPLRWVKSAYPWQVPGTALASFAGPRTWQAETLDQVGEHLRSPRRFEPCRISKASGHGIGKSALVGQISQWAMSTCVDTRAVLTSNTGAQLQTKTGPEVAKWFGIAANAHWFEIQSMAIKSLDPGKDKSWRLDFSTWSRNNLEAFAGLHNLGRRIVLIMDEASGIMDRVFEVAMGALTDENTEIIWLLFGNPTQNTGYFHSSHHKLRNLWTPQQIDSRTVEGTNKTYLQEIVDTYGEDHDITRVRVKGQFPRASSLQFIDGETVQLARKRVCETYEADAMIIGVDCARFGDDESVIAVRKGRNAKIVDWKHFSKIDTMALASEVMAMQAATCADAVFVDEGGLGAGVVDRLRQLNCPGMVGIQFGGKPDGGHDLPAGMKVRNKRTEMWAVMREWLKGGAIPDNDTLESDLTGVEYGFNADDEIMLERKEDMKKRGLASPDWGDALALTFAYSVLPGALRNAYLGGTASNGGRLQSDFDTRGDV